MEKTDLARATGARVQHRDESEMHLLEQVPGTTIGVVGGLFPAIRAARLPVTVALRTL